MTAHRLIKRGELPSRKIGRKVIILRADAEAWLNNLESKPNFEIELNFTSEQVAQIEAAASNAGMSSEDFILSTIQRLTTKPLNVVVMTDPFAAMGSALLSKRTDE